MRLYEMIIKLSMLRSSFVGVGNCCSFWCCVFKNAVFMLRQVVFLLRFFHLVFMVSRKGTRW